MKIPVICPKCVDELGQTIDEFVVREFRDDNRYEVCCSRGHQTVTVLQQQKFELLFDVGAYAIIDGYYREAISSFTSSLERFYEFCIKVFFKKSDFEEYDFEKLWKQVSNQSERQLGAFMFLWAKEYCEIPDLLSNNDTKLRNAVIHKGKIANREEALQYGNRILEIIVTMGKHLQSTFPEAVESIISKHIMDSSEVGDEYMCASVPTAMNAAIQNNKQENLSLEDALPLLIEWRKLSADNLVGTYEKTNIPETFKPYLVK